MDNDTNETQAPAPQDGSPWQGSPTQAPGTSVGQPTQAQPTYPQPAYPQQPHVPQPAPRPRSGARGVLLGIIGGLVGAGALVAALLGLNVIGSPSPTTPTTGMSQSVTISPSDEDATTATAVAAKALPSVVSVYCSYEDGEGMGSGVILDTDGNILTNYHVIEGATAISVTIDGKSYAATVVGSDSSSDLAVINAELEGDAVTPIEVGDSGTLSVGDWVMTIGSPFGLEQSVSQGIVSALYRNELMEDSSGNTIYANLIQVDASINPGNSGGALVDSQGQLVGICTLYSSDTESFAGVGFAIPGNYAVQIARTIISGEPVTHAYIGLGMQTVNAQNAQANHLSVNQGAYVAEVYADSPAAAAGIESGDIVIGMDGEAISSADGMILAVRSHGIGDTVTVTVMRGDDEMSFEVTLGSDEALQSASPISGPTPGTQEDSDVVREFEEWLDRMREQDRQEGPVGGLGSYAESQGTTGSDPVATSA